MRPLLYVTDQDRTLRHAGYSFFAGAALVLVAKWIAETARFEITLAVGVIGAAAMVTGAFLAMTRVRCPGCGLRWVRWSVANQPHTQWIHWLYQFHTCPKCGYTEGAATSQ